MIANEWKIAKSDHTCRNCAVKFMEGEPYFSVLLERQAGFEREDFCPACFEACRPETFFSFWKTAVPVEGEQAHAKPVLDIESVMEFFRRLSNEQEAQKVAFRFVLALMLTRKKVLKLVGSEKDGEDREALIFSERGGERHNVIQPDLDEQEIVSVSAELGQLLGLTPSSSAGKIETEIEAEKGDVFASGEEIQNVDRGAEMIQTSCSV